MGQLGTVPAGGVPCTGKAGSPWAPHLSHRSTPAKTDATVALLPAAPPHHPPPAHPEPRPAPRWDPCTVAPWPGAPCLGPHGISHHLTVPSCVVTALSPLPLACTMAKPPCTSQLEAKTLSEALCILATAPSSPGSPTEQTLLAPGSRTRCRMVLPDGAAIVASWQQAPCGQSAAKPHPSMTTAWAMGRSWLSATAGAMVGCPQAGSPRQGLLSPPWPPACTGC